MKRLIVLVALTGCELSYEPDVGLLHADEIPADAAPGSDAAVSALARCVDSDPATDVSFSQQVRPITAKSPGGCLSCHGTSSASGFNLGSYESLRRGGMNSGTRIVVPGDPCASILLQKLSVAPPFGARMPYNGPPYFTADELTVVKDWIAEGAHDN
jgi:hypothetical protein